MEEEVSRAGQGRAGQGMWPTWESINMFTGFWWEN